MARAISLAQLVYQPPKLDAGSFISRTVFESPALAIIALVAVGFVLLYSYQRAGKVRASIGSATVCALLAITLFVTAKIVTTPRERVRDLSRELVGVVSSADTDRLDQLLRIDMLLSPGSLSMMPFGEMDKPATIAAVRARFGSRTDGPSVHAGQINASARNGRGTSHVLAVGSGFEFGSGRSWWEIQWVQADGAWQVRSITPMWVLGM